MNEYGANKFHNTNQMFGKKKGTKKNAGCKSKRKSQRKDSDNESDENEDNTPEEQELWKEATAELTQQSWWTALDCGSEGPWTTTYNSPLNDLYWRSVMDAHKIMGIPEKERAQSKETNKSGVKNQNKNKTNKSGVKPVDETRFSKSFVKGFFDKSQRLNAYSRTKLYFYSLLGVSTWGHLTVNSSYTWFQYLMNKYSYVDFSKFDQSDTIIKDFYNECMSKTLCGKVCCSQHIANNMFFTGWSALFDELKQAIDQGKCGVWEKMNNDNEWPDYNTMTKNTINAFYDKYGSSLPLRFFCVYFVFYFYVQ